MKPSMTISMRRSAAPSMAPAIIAISKPPYSDKACSGSVGQPPRRRACFSSSRLCARPVSSSPVPGPVTV